MGLVTSRGIIERLQVHLFEQNNLDRGTETRKKHKELPKKNHVQKTKKRRNTRKRNEMRDGTWPYADWTSSLWSRSAPCSMQQ
jgi:hypothetical protein